MPCFPLHTALALCLAALCSALPAVAARAPLRPTASVPLNFPATDIEAATRAMAAILNRPIVVDPRVKGQLTLYSEQALTPAQAYAMYLTALRGLGFAVVAHGGLLTVLPEAEAKLQADAPAADGAAPHGDQVLTQVFRVQHENANNLLAVLRPLISPNNTINANAGNNTLVLTDYASNLGRLAALIAALDTPSATDVEVIPLKHTVAAELALTVQRLGGDGGATGAAPGGVTAQAAVVSADHHTNALLVRAPNPARLAAVRALVARLDQPGSSGTAGSNIHLVYLKYADATRLAQVLRAAFPALGSGSSSGGGAAVGTGPSSGAAAVLASTGGGASAAGSSTGTSGSGAASTQSTAAVSAAAAPSTGGAIPADPATNSLVITAVA
ncbi:MAG: type II secretion system protein GspD, partial [Burkholderiales bacterium PBB5]